MKNLTSVLLVVLAFQSFVAPAYAEDVVTESAQDMKKGAKKGMNKVKDKTCEIVNGKMQCLGKKIKHKMENATEEVKDKTN